VRFVDVLGLAFSALLQQKVRTTLTTLGVVFGTFILVASLSVRAGVKETIVEQYAKFGELRRIEVNPRYEPLDKESQIPPDRLEVKGAMSDAKRRRLRQQIINRWESARPAAAPQKRLTPEAVQALASLEHVRSVEPTLGVLGWVNFGGKTEVVQTIAASADHPLLQPRLEAGAPFGDRDPSSVVVSEYLLYRLGVADDAEVQQALGKKLRLECRFQERGMAPGFLVTLLTGGGSKVSREEDTALAKVLKQLPDALDKFDLTKAEQGTLRSLLKLSAASTDAPKQTNVADEFTICGVFRSSEKTDPRHRWGWLFDRVDLVIPAKAAEALFFQAPSHRESGLDHVSIEVDDMQHVKETIAKINEMGFNAHSMIERIEMEQFTYNLIFSSMTVFAALGLLVAAFGITNTMLMSVLERVREIGVMKAVGARNGHIQAIFLLEGAWVGLVGGVVGLLLAWVASFPGDAWVRSVVSSNLSIQLESSIFRFPLWLQAAAPGFACLIATLGAYYPARQAARVNPISALRHD
jgi:putative ABC transport system permease protein